MSRHWFWLLKCTNDLLLAWKLWHCWCNVQMWNNLAERKRNQKWKKKMKKRRRKRIDVNNYPEDLQILPSSETTITETSSWYLRRSPWGISSSSWKSIPANNHQEALIRMRKRRADINYYHFPLKFSFMAFSPNRFLIWETKARARDVHKCLDLRKDLFLINFNIQSCPGSILSLYTKSVAPLAFK